MKILYMAVGLLALVFGIVGIITPILPTTPFILLSAFCFARSSKRFHNWITNHWIFGPMIENYQQVGVSPRVKVIAGTFATFSIFLTACFTGHHLLLFCVWVLVGSIIGCLPYRKEKNKIPP